MDVTGDYRTPSVWYKSRPFIHIENYYLEPMSQKPPEASLVTIQLSVTPYAE